MNRSYSKIRHIQESNLKLERRLINEMETDTSDTDITPTTQELQAASSDFGKDMKYILGKKLIDLYLANNPESSLSLWLNQNNYKKLSKRLQKIKLDYSRFGEGVLEYNKLVWLGGKYIKDENLKKNLDRIKQEHIQDYKKYHPND